VTLRSDGIFLAQSAIASTGRELGLLVHGNRTLEPVIEELFQPVQIRYDLDW
jgi:hypothetical protein